MQTSILQTCGADAGNMIQTCGTGPDLLRRPPGPAQRSTEEGTAAHAAPVHGAGGPAVARSGFTASSAAVAGAAGCKADV